MADQKKGPYRNTARLTIACHMKDFVEVVGGLEPPWKVLQTRALPLGHATL